MLEHQYKEVSGHWGVLFLFGLHLDMHSVDADGTKSPCRRLLPVFPAHHSASARKEELGVMGGRAPSNFDIIYVHEHYERDVRDFNTRCILIWE